MPLSGYNHDYNVSPALALQTPITRHKSSHNASSLESGVLIGHPAPLDPVPPLTL